jgi:phosphoribosylamine--glycine ligase
MKKLDASEARVLVIGSGGREHAIGMQMENDGVENLFFAPGNGGTAMLGTNVPISPNDFTGLNEFVKKEEIDLIIVGSEDPLAGGIVDFFRRRNVLIIGPTKDAAQLESNKAFARVRMEDADIPQPIYLISPDREQTEEMIGITGLPVVLKFSGLAAGKGAFVCHTESDIKEALKAIYEDKKFGEGPVLIEECLSGQEMSVFVLCNENSHVIIGTAQDYKRLRDGDKGPNTGGMGSISPSPLITRYPDLMEKIETRIIVPILKEMKNNHLPFTGFLYCGLMITNGEPYVIEFNCRLGDPETQVVLPLIKSNFFKLLWRAANNEDLAAKKLKFYDHLAAAFIVKVAGGYPGDYRKGDIIETPDSESTWCEIIHAGTKLNDKEELVTNGGRVIGVLGLADSLFEAVEKVYEDLDQIHFADEFYRRDIGKF